MHLLMILSALIFAFILRVIPRTYLSRNFSQNWRQIVLLFILPPLFLLMTALAILFMGFRGQMLGLQVIWWGNLLAIFFLILALTSAIKLIIQMALTKKEINYYPRKKVLGRKAIILPIEFPYCAQIGIVKPQLVISQGLITLLDNHHLEAVLLHEESHNYYRDSLCFFVWNWLKYFSFWLPQTEKIWQDLLLLREIRADKLAAQQSSPLVVAESLLMVTENASRTPFQFSIPFSAAVPFNRLSARIDALLLDKLETKDSGYYHWTYLLIIFLPWIGVLLHN